MILPAANVNAMTEGGCPPSDDPRGPADQCGVRERGGALVAGRQPDRVGGAADLAQPASGQGTEIDPDHDVRVEQREQCVEVAAAGAIQAPKLRAGFMEASSQGRPWCSQSVRYSWCACLGTLCLICTHMLYVIAHWSH